MPTPMQKSPMEDPAGYLARQSGKKVLLWLIIVTLGIALFFTALFFRVGFMVDYYGMAINPTTKQYFPYTYSKLIDFGSTTRLPSPGDEWNVYAGRYIQGDLGSTYEDFSTPYGTCDGLNTESCAKGWGLTQAEIPSTFRTQVMVSQAISLVAMIIVILMIFILIGKLRKRGGKSSSST